jgi:hypothetical protein
MADKLEVCYIADRLDKRDMADKCVLYCGQGRHGVHEELGGNGEHDGHGENA